MKRCFAFSLFLSLFSIILVTNLQADDNFPPGWLPVAALDKGPTWREVRDIQDRIHLYLPNESEPVRGVFACFVFHSGDPRELADLWNFALVTVPWPFEYDLGHNDKRNGRYKLGHASQDMGLLLRYLDQAAKQTKHPELSTVPIVGWLGQNGSRECADLYSRAPQRVLAWSDSFPNRLRQYPELTQHVPFHSRGRFQKRPPQWTAIVQKRCQSASRPELPGHDLWIRARYLFEIQLFLWPISTAALPRACQIGCRRPANR